MRRKQALDSKLDRVFHFIIDEAALLRPIGSAGTMHAQFEEILGFSAAPNVTVQVVPFAAGPHPGVDGSFTIQKFDQENLHDVVFVEGLAGAWLIDNVDHVRLYREVFSVLSERALDPEASRYWLRRLRSV
jgi:hypothetical protein